MEFEVRPKRATKIPYAVGSMALTLVAGITGVMLAGTARIGLQMATDSALWWKRFGPGERLRTTALFGGTIAIVIAVSLAG